MLLDSSVLFSLFFPEARSAAVERIVTRLAPPMITALAPLELHDAIGRAIRNRRLDVARAQAVRAAFAESVAEGMWKVVGLSSAHLARAAEWLADPDAGLRTLDAIHVSAAHALGVPLLTADRAQARAAKRLGVKVKLV
jgi:predicted nucleic acid-binding protein